MKPDLTDTRIVLRTIGPQDAAAPYFRHFGLVVVSWQPL